MNKQFTRMQKLAGIITEGYQGTDHDFSEGMVQDVVTKEGISGKMSKEEAKKKMKEAILAELETTAGINAYDEVDSLDEAKKKKEEEEDVDIESDVEGDVDNLDLDLDTTDTGEDTQVDMDMDTTGDIDAGSSESKKAFSELTDAYRAAKELGDEKLIRQIANTITYFNKNIILKQG